MSWGRDSVQILVFNCLSAAWLIELSMGYYCQFFEPTQSFGNHNILWQQIAKDKQVPFSKVLPSLCFEPAACFILWHLVLVL